MILVLTGTYLDGPPMMPAARKTPRPDHRMLAAILPGTQYQVFLKMTAPAAIADQARTSFIEMVKSALD